MASTHHLPQARKQGTEVRVQTQKRADPVRVSDHEAQVSIAVTVPRYQEQCLHRQDVECCFGKLMIILHEADDSGDEERYPGRDDTEIP